LFFTFQIERFLKSGGAQSKLFLSDQITHMICATNYNEEELSMNLDLYSAIPVTEQWIVHSAKLGRMASTRAFDPSPNQLRLMRGIRVAITNVVAGDRRRLYAMLTYHGAVVTHSFGATNTHLVCGAANGGIYNKALALPKNAIIIVTPDWVTDSLKYKNCMPGTARTGKTSAKTRKHAEM